MILKSYKEKINNHIYSVMITERYRINDEGKKVDLGFEGTVWAEDGSTVILEMNFINIEEFEKQKKVAIKNFEKHIIRCCDCGKKCNYYEIKHNRYFAGVYCDRCWNDKWKAIEAQEDYN